MVIRQMPRPTSSILMRASALDFLAGAVYTTSLCGMDHQR
jgi:hypothetical protein